MVKAPSSHGLDRKYKSWRRGKSANAKHSGKSSSSSVKQQLRGLQRLYDKKSSTSQPRDDAQLAELQAKIDTLRQQIHTRNVSEKEKANATKSHKMRFIERQRTTRLFKDLTKRQRRLQSSSSSSSSSEETANKTALERELYKLALDQVYIAHYPLDQSSYLSLYANGNVRRKQMNNRLLFKMASQRKTVLERLAATASFTGGGGGGVGNDNTNNHHDETTPCAGGRPLPRSSWIHPSQYDRVRGVRTWSTDQERTVFDVTTDGKTAANSRAVANDDRFQDTGNSQAMLLEEQKRIEEQVEQELGDDDDGDQGVVAAAASTKPRSTKIIANSESSSSDSDEDDNADPLAGRNSVLEKKSLDSSLNDENKSSDNTSSSSSDDDDDDEETVALQRRKNTTKKEGSKKQESSSSSSSSSDSSGSSDEDETITKKGTKPVPSSLDNSIVASDKSPRRAALVVKERKPDVDDFLVAAADHSNAFENAKRSVPSMDDVRGDKSKGWSTQRQLPGQFRKKQRR